METREHLQRTQGLMVFLGSVANGLEVLLGRGSDSVCFRSGRNVGLATKVAAREKDPAKAAELARQEMEKLGIVWPLTPFKKSTEAELVVENSGVREMKLAIQNCIVRCTLFRYGFPQKQSLCHSKHGLFCGLFDQINDNRSTMEILHAGENGCLLKLRMFK
jgi:predicted hydrocarbon binding protein